MAEEKKKASKPRTRQTKAKTQVPQVDRQKKPEEEEVKGSELNYHEPLQNVGRDQHAEEAKRQAELAEERRIHNERTAGIRS